MVIQMSEYKNYCMVSKLTNLCENVCLWDGNTNTWQPPDDYLMLEQSTTLSKVWAWSESANAWHLNEHIGMGQIGFTWDGTYLITNEPMPEPQPVVYGAKTL